ncbi:putative mannan endo-1,4-beta-mannosidase [Rosa chinensis]|uniref:mannan endo-1,4-beta-mannosidase n=1 Tax=Rosa chinensis TaxID=74649 RepID=A0A2P6QJK7_ROSCH|nr:putative mannan endo-1,4-beta-mannosidase [Rosa chinensis]
MMYMASDPSTQAKVTSAFQQASKYKMNVARTWAFSDGVGKALQTSPGSYNEDMFKAKGSGAELWGMVLCPGLGEFVRPAEEVAERCSVPGSVGAATKESLICMVSMNMAAGSVVAIGDEGGRVPRSDCWPKSSWGPKSCWVSKTVEMFSSIWTCFLTKLMVSGPLGFQIWDPGGLTQLPTPMFDTGDTSLHTMGLILRQVNEFSGVLQLCALAKEDSSYFTLCDMTFNRYGLDFVISEAKKYGVYLILSLVNNYNDFGGRKQYVQWARERGQSLNSDDDFYNNTVVKGYYQNHVKTILTRINTITNVAYKDDPIIFAWELINELRCESDVSGALLQQWVNEMAAHLKSIDGNHLLEIGLEGFYGATTPEKQQYNPNNQELGSDFTATNLLPQVDFATIHIYAEQWLSGQSEEAQAAFVDKWVQVHIDDCNTIMKKPLIMAEFGKSWKYPGYTIENRNAYFGKLYDAEYSSAKSGGACVGGLFWQLFAQGMENFGDGYQVVLEESPSTADVIAQQSQRLQSLN